MVRHPRCFFALQMSKLTSTPQQFSRWLIGTSAEGVDYPALRRLVEQYPYFWPAGLLQMFVGDEDLDAETAARLRQLYAVSPARVMAEIAFGGLTYMEDQETQPIPLPVSEPEATLLPVVETTAPGEPQAIQSEESITHSLEHDPLEDAVAHTFGVEEGGALHNAATASVAENEPPVASTADDVPQTPVQERVSEPFFTSDYFSHQGVQVDAALPAGDSLNSDAGAAVDGDDASDPDRGLMVMRSFSDWMQHFQQTSRKAQEEEESKRAVRAMWQKEKLAAALEEEEEEIPEAVFQMAVASIESDGVGSESLAEVLAGQGKWERAVDMYRKLATGEPSKSAYFARKIEALEARHAK